MTIDKTKTGWDQITNIACSVAGCSGELRWAEAGYVPGYRICDCCGSHYALADLSGPAGGLKIVKRLKPSPAKIATMKSRRQAEQIAAVNHHQNWLEQQTSEANAQWLHSPDAPTSHGYAVSIPDQSTDSASGCLIDQIQPAEFAALIRRCWSITAKLRALPDVPNNIQVMRITRDGKYGMVYHVTHTYGWFDGWWDMAALEAALASAPEGLYTTAAAAGKLTAEQRKQLNVWR